MPQALLVSPRTAQPIGPTPPNWNSPWGNGLVLLEHLTPDACSFDLVSGQPNVVAGAPGTARHSAGVGLGFSTSLGGTTNDALQTPLATHSDKRTYLIVPYLFSQGGQNRLFDKNSVGGTSSERLQTNSSTTSLRYCRNFSTTEGQWTFGASGSRASYILALTYDSSSTANNPTVYVNGGPVTVTRAQAPVGTPVTTTDPFILGADPNSTANVWAGGIFLFAVWDRLFSAAEMAEITANPWQIFAPATRRLLLPPVDGSALNLAASYTEEASQISAAVALLTGANLSVTEGNATLGATLLNALAANGSITETGDTAASGAGQVLYASQIIDAFSGTSLNSTLWTASDSATVADGKLTLNRTTGSGDDSAFVTTGANVYLPDNELVVRIDGSSYTSSWGWFVVVGDDAFNYEVGFGQDSTGIYGYVTNLGDQTLTYIGAVPTWVKLEISGSTARISTAPNNSANPPASGDWTLLHSLLVSGYLDRFTGLRAKLVAFKGSTLVVDAVNTGGSSAPLTGAAAILEGADPLAADLSAALVASAALVEEADVTGAATAVTPSASLSTADVPDAFTAAAATTVGLTVTTTDGADAVAGAAVGAVVASAVLTEAADAVLSVGAIAAIAQLAVAEAADALAGAGAAPLSATLAAAEAADAFSSSAGAVAGLQAAIVDADDVQAAAAVAALSGAAPVAEASDAAAAGATAALVASSSTTNSSDVLTSAVVTALVSANAALVEAGDAAAGGLAVGVVASAAVGEAADAVISTGAATVVGAAVLADGVDVLHLDGAGAPLGGGPVGSGPVGGTGESAAPDVAVLVTADASSSDAGDDVAALIYTQSGALADVQEQDDAALAAAGTVLVALVLSQDDGDVVVAASSASIVSDVDVQEAADTVDSGGTAAMSVAAGVLEADDQFEILAGGGTSFDSSITDLADALEADAAAALAVEVHASEIDDLVSAGATTASGASASVQEQVDVVVSAATVALSLQGEAFDLDSMSAGALLVLAGDIVVVDGPDLVAAAIHNYSGNCPSADEIAQAVWEYVQRTLTGNLVADIAKAVRQESVMGPQTPGTLGAMLQETAARVAGGF